MSPVRILIVAHAPLAGALRQAALHAFPECEPDVVALDVDAEWSVEMATQRLQTCLESFPGPTLVLVDVVGATPANAMAAARSAPPEARVVAGVNLPMLWRALCYRARSASLDELAERALEGGARGIMCVPLMTS